MILVDTSVWVDYFRSGLDALAIQLERGNVFTHPLILGELACGNLKNREQTLHLLSLLPRSEEASHEEVMMLIDTHKLMGKGIGFIDAHLLAASLLSENAQLWTHDKRLANVAAELGSCFQQQQH